MTDDLIANKIGKRKNRRAKSATNKKINRVERHSFSVYHGQNALGFVEQRGDAFTAKTIKGKKIGIFGSLKLAADAISDVAEAA